jgi:hypothetical protein
MGAAIPRAAPERAGAISSEIQERIKTGQRRKNVTTYERARAMAVGESHSICIWRFEVRSRSTRRLSERLHRWSAVQRGVLLKSIRGICLYFALVIYSEIGDGSRFLTGEHVFSPAGLSCESSSRRKSSVNGQI